MYVFPPSDYSGKCGQRSATATVAMADDGFGAVDLRVIKQLRKLGRWAQEGPVKKGVMGKMRGIGKMPATGVALQIRSLEFNG